MKLGPALNEKNLVFGYDTGRNPSSGFDHRVRGRRYFKGRNSTNVVTNTNLDTGWSKGYQTSIVFDEIDPPAGIDSPVVGFNKSSSSSYWYSYGDYAPQTPSVTYTVSMYVKTRDSNFRIRFYTANNSETGRVFGSYITVPNDGKWHRIIWDSFLNPSNSQSDSLSFNFVMADTGDSSRTWFCAPQMEANSNASPFTDGTRSSTNSLIDLAKNSTIDVNNVSFDSTGLPTFDGTDDYISKTRYQYSITEDWTVELVFKPTDNSDTSWNGLFGGGLGAGGYWMFHNNGKLTYYEGYSGNSKIKYTSWSKADTFSQDNYHHLTITYTSTSASTGTYVIYYNGGEKTYTFNWTFTFSHSLDSQYIGAGGGNRFGTNNVSVYKEYDRVLTAREIKQNYNQYKNRFNL